MPVALIEPRSCEEVACILPADRLWMLVLDVRALEDLRPTPSRSKPLLRGNIYQGIVAMRESHRAEYERDFREAAYGSEEWAKKRRWLEAFNAEPRDRREWSSYEGSAFTVSYPKDVRGTFVLMRVRNLGPVAEAVFYDGWAVDRGAAEPLPRTFTVEELSRATAGGVGGGQERVKKSSQAGALYQAMMKSAKT